MTDSITDPLPTVVENTRVWVVGRTMLIILELFPTTQPAFDGIGTMTATLGADVLVAFFEDEPAFSVVNVVRFVISIESDVKLEGADATLTPVLFLRSNMTIRKKELF